MNADANGPLAWPEPPPADNDRATAKPVPTGLAAAAIGQIGAYVLAGLGVLAFFYDPNTENRIRDGLWPTVSQFPLLWSGLLFTLFVAARMRKESIRTLTNFSVRLTDALYIFAGVFLQYAGGLAYTLLKQNENASKPAEDLIDNARNNTLGFFVLAAAVAIGAPLVEELFYRGLITQGFERLFRRRLSVRPTFVLSVVASGVWFAAIHFQLLQFPLLFVVGAVCAALTLREKRLGPAIFVHLGFNLTTVIALGLQLRADSGR